MLHGLCATFSKIYILYIKAEIQYSCDLGVTVYDDSM